MKRFTKVIATLTLMIGAFFTIGCTKPNSNDGGGGNSSEGSAPEGCIDGKFTVNEFGRQVYFSKGNLQYQPSTNTWRFADKQYDMSGLSDEKHYFAIEEHYDSEYPYAPGVDYHYYYVGPETEITEEEYNAVVTNHPDDYKRYVYVEHYTEVINWYTSSYSGWIDLFAWGTSGFDHGATCYQPWCYEYLGLGEKSYYAYGQKTCNLYDKTGHADWGYNVISNGGNKLNFWRTMTKEEWDFVLNGRNTLMGARYAKAQLNDINGIVLFPDNWDNTVYLPNQANTERASFSSNKISLSKWTTLEKHGAVFLPAAGLRKYHSGWMSGSICEFVLDNEFGPVVLVIKGLRIESTGQNGEYWTSSYYPELSYPEINCIGCLFFVNDDNRIISQERNIGRSVRLVCPVE